MTSPYDPISSPISELPRLLLLSASAGTGKTWMISHLAARWLTEDPDARCERLLMVTFSRAAAGELRGRLRRQLDAFISVAEDGVSTNAPDWQRVLYGLFETIGVDVVRQRLHRALSSIDAVHARTIHSFASALVAGPDASLVDGTEPRRRAAREVIASRSAAGDGALLGLLATMEGAGGRRPAAEVLEDTLASALGVLQSTKDVDLVGEDDAADAVSEQLVLEARDRASHLLSRESAATYDSVISSMVDEVRRNAELVDRVKGQFSLVLIDEFQDTDALQWEAFRRLFVEQPDPVPVVLVGDPKQAIYGFRGGDVSVFQRVEREIEQGGGARHELDMNFRSAGELLRRVGTLFERADAEGWWFSKSAPPIRFHQVRPAPALSDVDGHAMFVTSEGDVIQEAVGVTSELCRLGVRARDIAVLFARGWQVHEFTRRLNRAGIRAVTPLSASVFTSFGAQQVRTALWCLADDDPRRGRTLRATCFGAAQVSAPLARRTLESRGVAALARILMTHDTLRELLEGPDGERHVTDINHVFELLGREHPGPLSPARALDVLDRLSAAIDEDAAVALQRRIESDADAVSVMTVHGAKGLEFPVVLVPNCTVGPGSNAQPRVQSWSDGQRRYIDLASVRASSSTREEVTQAARDEARRLIYVALTRAKTALVVWDEDETDLSELLALGQGAFDPFDAVAVAASFEDRDAETLSVTPVVDDMPFVDERLRRWSYTALSVHGPAHARDVGDEDHPYDGAERAEDYRELEAPTPRDAFPGLYGAAFGRALHGVLEDVVGRVGAHETDVLARVATRHLGAEGLNADPDAFVASLRRVLERPLGNVLDNASLDDLVGAARSTNELRFTLPLRESTSDDRLRSLCQRAVELDPHGPFLEFFAAVAHDERRERLAAGFLTGSLDLVVATERGRYVVMDYKTNVVDAHSGYGANGLRSEMAASGYPLQALLYLVALHRHLAGRLSDYDPDHHLAGAAYYYVRGVTVDASAEECVANWTPPADLVLSASRLFGDH